MGPTAARLLVRAAGGGARRLPDCLCRDVSWKLSSSSGLEPRGGELTGGGPTEAEWLEAAAAAAGPGSAAGLGSALALGLEAGPFSLPFARLGRVAFCGGGGAPLATFLG